MKQISFNRDWLFEKETTESRMKAFYGKRDMKQIDLPYDAMIREKRDKETPAGAQSGFYPGGKYVYEKHFTADDSWKQNDVILEFEGVYGNTSVWVNGFMLKKNHNGYVGFYVDITPVLRFEQENIVRVEVDNSQQPNSRWYTGSGIYRNVNIWLGSSVYVKNDATKITTKYLADDIAQIGIKSVLKKNSKNVTSAKCLIEIIGDGNVVTTESQEIFFIKNEENIQMEVPINTPIPWSVDKPYLYQLRLSVIVDETCVDSVKIPFGVRTLSINSKHGVIINNESIKLRGTCIHHDNGIIGAETFEEAEDYRCRKIKEAGFNAIRSAHNPLSKAMLNACDRYGILVMDELTDVWNKHKNPYDFADVFYEEIYDWAESMIAKDYNHPSVIIYSIGNEISEAGSKQGADINRRICNKIHELDDTRYTVNSINALNCAGSRLKSVMKEIEEHFDSTDKQSGNGQGSNALNTFMSLMQGEKGDYFSKHPLISEALEECSQSCDIIGLNYLSGRYELEKELHPNKTVLGTETYPADIYNLWSLVKKYDHVIGDFTWTGYDYIGEAGVGIFHYDGNANFTSVYPERLAYIGDIDILGNRRPISYYREIVYGLRKSPYIAVERMNHNGETSSKTAWMFKDNISSWTWDGYEGQMAQVDVYSLSEKVELFLNGVSLGIKNAGEENQYIASFSVIYEPGELKAIGYTNGNIDGEYILVSARKASRIVASRVTQKERDLIFVQARIVDEDGVMNLSEDKVIMVEVSDNLSIEGYGSANPASEDDYFQYETLSYDGCVMVAVRVKEKDKCGRVVFTTGDGWKEELIVGK